MITACKKEPENRVALKSPLSEDITFLQWVSAVLVSRCSDSPQGLYCTLCELQQPSTRSTLGNYFRVLIETHVFYFAAWAHDLNDIVLSHWTFSRTRYTTAAWTSVVSPNIGVCYPWLTSTFNHSSSFLQDSPSLGSLHVYIRTAPHPQCSRISPKACWRTRN
jgi:hypothetical protein